MSAHEAQEIENRPLNADQPRSLRHSLLSYTSAGRAKDAQRIRFQTKGLSLNWILLPKYEPRSIYRRRAEFGTVRCHVRDYPSLGGIILGAFTAVELEWLG